jgi:endonuclease III
VRPAEFYFVDVTVAGGESSELETRWAHRQECLCSGWPRRAAKIFQMRSPKIKPMTPRERALALAERFRKVYPDAHCELDFKNPLQLLIATILSAQCTDKRVNMVTPALFKKYPDARAFAKARPATFESEIRSTGFFRSKTKSILGASQAIVSKHAGQVPDSMEELCALPGVGRKTANVVLGNAFGKNEGIVVDTHVIRLSQRFELTKNSDAEKIERDLMKIVPQRDWTLWSHWLIWHGRRRCFARKPDCANCEVFALCPSGKIFLRSGEAKQA